MPTNFEPKKLARRAEPCYTRGARRDDASMD
jgi:hypothetical protein